MFLGEVRILHGGLEISVAYRLLHMDGVFLLGQPSGDAAVSKVVLSEAWWRFTAPTMVLTEWRTDSLGYSTWIRPR